MDDARTVTTRVDIVAFAKLNLWLHVLGETRDDGYHDIETLFHTIELHDDVSVSLAPNAQRTIHCSEDIGPDAHNLAFRAAVAYSEAARWPTGFHIAITKRIPAAGGLGGGSSDAAATLVALDQMSPRRLDASALRALGTGLGADIPFLLTREPAALAWGRGDRLVSVPALPQKHVALIVPGFGIGTREAYRTLPKSRLTTREDATPADARDWGWVLERARNDLARSAAVRGHGEIAAAISALRAAGALMADLTGSGSVVFGIFDSEPDETELRRATGSRVILTRTAVGVEGPTSLD